VSEVIICRHIRQNFGTWIFIYISFLDGLKLTKYEFYLDSQKILKLHEIFSVFIFKHLLYDRVYEYFLILRFFSESRNRIYLFLSPVKSLYLGIIELLETKNSSARSDFTYIYKAIGNVRNYKVLLAILIITFFLL
jgi:hypothetical protein